MARINVVHVVGGGVLAGLVINITGGLVWNFILADDYVTQVGKDLPGRVMPGSFLWSFLIGIVTVWLYASLRTHYGSWLKTAVIAGVTTWILGVALPSSAIWLFGIFGGSLLAIASAFGVIEFVLAAVAGAWVYNWGEAVEAHRAQGRLPLTS
jgi:hypothetical protein